MWRDLRYGWRRLASQPLFSGAAVLLLALGIASNTVVFSIVNSLLLKPLAVRDPQNLYLFEQTKPRQVRPETSFFYRQFQAIEQSRQWFAGAVAEQGWAGNSFQALAVGESVELVSTQIVSPNYFRELGVKARLGRILDETDAAASGTIPVVLSEQCWRREFANDPQILGRVIRVRNSPFLVVGVLPKAFHGADADRVPDVRLPISAAPAMTGFSVTEPGGDYPIEFQVLARLASGVSPKAAASAMTPVLTSLSDSLWRDWYGRSSKWFPVSELNGQLAFWREYRVGLAKAERGISRLREQFSRAVVVLMGAVGLLMLVVCASLGGLLLAKAQDRRQEMAVRISLGADRWQLARMFYAENVLLVIAGGLLGLLFALVATPLLLRFMPSLGIGAYSPAAVLDVEPDLRVLGFVVATSLATIGLMGLASIRGIRQPDANRQLGDGGRSVSRRATYGMVAFQVGLSVVLLYSSLLMLATFWTLKHMNPGFDAGHVVEATLNPWDAGETDREAQSLLVQLKQRIEELPGVGMVSFAGSELMRGIGTKTTVVPAGARSPANTFLNTSLNRVTPEYFATLGIPLLAGRNFELSDAAAKPANIVVNRAFADHFFPGANPIGKAIVAGIDGRKAPTALIVGMVGTAKYRSMREIDPPIYYNVTDVRHAGGVLYVRTRENPEALAKQIRKIVRQLAPRVPLGSIYTLRQEVDASLWQERLITLLSAFFGWCALLLCGVSVYSVLSYSVRRRARELGIRMAVGAQAGDVVRTVSARLGVGIGVGLAAGTVGSMLALRLLGELLFRPEQSSVGMAALAALLLLMGSLVAAAVPTWRALRIEPAAALRRE